jgi:arylsulfatase A-like enzyme
MAASLGCEARAASSPLLTAELPLHLEDHLGTAHVTGSELPPDPPRPLDWRFDQAQSEWKAAPSWNPTIAPTTVTMTGEALRVTLTDKNRNLAGIPVGGIYIDVPDWDRADWADLVIRARSDSSVNRITLGFNLREGRGPRTVAPFAFQQLGHNMPVVRDSTIHTYRLRIGFSPQGSAQGRVKQLGIWFATDGNPGSIDVLSISAVPVGAAFVDPAFGARQVTLAERTRRSLYVHAPARAAFRVRVPQHGKLSTSLGVLRADATVTFRVRVQPGRGEAVIVLEEKHADPERWAHRSVDLSKFAGQAVTLALETESDKPGTVALWSTPTVSGARTGSRPNVIFYVIDGGGADQMSVYGYNRRTTPNLEELAREGALFERAHSTASWSQPSTTSFMTSLHSSVLGNYERFAPLPAEARPMAERFREGGYQTAVFTSNPWAGSAGGLDRGVDVFRDKGVDVDSQSSEELQQEYWDWREAYPGEPYWVHFQTTDVHWPHEPRAPFAGLFAPPDLKKQYAKWDSTLDAWRSRNMPRMQADRTVWGKRWAETGIDRIQYYGVVRAIYDETLAHQDYQLGRFIERLKERGEWENTILVIAADHGIEAASTDFVKPLSDSLPPDLPWAVLRSSISRVPLIFSWPGHIQGGQRFSQPVSMIDVLPTLLELSGLSLPEILQGQSLAPLLLGRDGYTPRPIIFDDFGTDNRTGELEGYIEVIDGRWGASLEIRAPSDTTTGRPTPLLLFDVWNDPMALKLMNDERPDLVKKYTEFLQKQWEAHQLLAKRFTSGGKIELTPEQIETLRALGYIR